MQEDRTLFNVGGISVDSIGNEYVGDMHPILSEDFSKPVQGKNCNLQFTGRGAHRDAASSCTFSGSENYTGPTERAS